MKIYCYVVMGLFCWMPCMGQNNAVKISHAEPLYVDLIRDLGARRGERELNVGFGMNDQRDFISYSGFLEYEFSPANRLGMEVEFPFSFYQQAGKEQPSEEIPRHRMEGIKTATQYTFWVSEKFRLSMAAGYMNELKMHSFITISDRHEWIKGNAYSPFFIVAKRWGANLHSLLYTGPVWEQDFKTGGMENFVQVNASVHYVIKGTSHFVGLECNQEIHSGKMEMILRPQAKLKISNGFYLGMLTGIPTASTGQKMSFMLRIIYEPKKKSRN